MSALRIGLLVAAYIAGQLGAPLGSRAQAPSAPAASFTPQQQQAREAILASDRWQGAHKQFHEWLAVQTTYDAAQVAAVKSELAARIAAMPADELTKFLGEMEARLAVLLSPDVAAARDWVDGFYTQRGKEQLAAKYDVSDPLDLSAMQLQRALAQFAADRQNHGAAQTAFQKSQAAQVAGAAQYQKTQQAAAASAARGPATFGTPASSYAPRREPRPQRYEAPYDPPRYSITPWGGVWIGF